jgi:tetratricopeptide (TPR) repeat protein
MKLDLKALFARATASHAAGHWQDAERDYRAVLNADAGHLDALHQLGLLAYQNGRPDVAIQLVGRAVAHAPSAANYHNTLASALLDAGRPLDAVRSFERARRLDGRSTEFGNNLARALEAAGRLDEAIALYREVLAAAPTDADVANNLGRALQADGKIDEAILHLRAAHALRPRDALILSHLGNALCASQAWDEAAATCAKAVELAPDSTVALANLGNALMGQRRFDAAVAAYLKAIAIAPDIVELHMNLGVARHAERRWPEAAACFERVLAAGADDRARLALARTCAAMGRLEDAAAHFRKVLEICPDAHEVRLDLGLVLNDLGRHGEGLREIERGPGVARLSTAGGGSAAVVARRIPLRAAGPTFIGGWFLGDLSLCDKLIDVFEKNAARHRQGRTSRGVEPSIKQTTDLVIFPRDLGTPAFAPVAAYLRELESCLADYAAQWPHLAEILTAADVVPFQIQRYLAGEHFQAPHSERMTFGLAHRVLAWMSYLDDVHDGGETRFHHFGLDVKPERGKTLIWPAEWTHVHAGNVVKGGRKHIITGWMHFPHSASQTGA